MCELICCIIAAVAAVINIKCFIKTSKVKNEMEAIIDKNLTALKLNSEQRCRVCAEICKFKDSNMGLEELEWQCSVCPLNQI